MPTTYASTDALNRRRRIQNSIEHYDDRGVAELVALHLFGQPLPPQWHTVNQVLNAMAVRPMAVQLAFTQAYRAQLGALNKSNVIEVHKVLFGLTARRAGIAALKALNILDDQWYVRS